MPLSISQNKFTASLGEPIRGLLDVYYLNTWIADYYLNIWTAVSHLNTWIAVYYLTKFPTPVFYKI